MKKGLVKEALFAFLILQSLLTGSGLTDSEAPPKVSTSFQELSYSLHLTETD